MGEVLPNFAFFGDLITNEDLEETYRNLYFFESFLYVGYGKNNEKAQNQVWREFFLGGFFCAKNPTPHNTTYLWERNMTTCTSKATDTQLQIKKYTTEGVKRNLAKVTKINIIARLYHKLCTL